MLQTLRGSLNRWSLWNTQSTNRRIFAQALTISALTVAVKLASLTKDLAVVHRFGASDALDAFLVAFLIPSYAINVLASTFSVSFMPTYVRVRDQLGRGPAQRLISSAVTCQLAALLFVVLIAAISAPFLLTAVAGGFDHEKLALTESLFYKLLVVLLLSGMSSLMASVLNAAQRFSLTSAAPMAVPLVTVLVLIHAWPQCDIDALAWGTVSGYALELLVLVWGVRQLKLSILPGWWGMNGHLKQINKQYLAAVGSVFLMGSSPLVDQAIATRLGPGSVTVLTFGNKAVALLLGTTMASLSIAIFPHFSRMAAAADWTGLRHTLRTYCKLVLVTTIPLTAAAVALSQPLATLLFHRGSMTWETTHEIGRVQAVYLLQLPFTMLGMIGVRLLSALELNSTLLKIGAANLVVNILCSLLLAPWLGVVGIALSTTLMYVFATLLIFASARCRLRELSRSQET